MSPAASREVRRRLLEAAGVLAAERPPLVDRELATAAGAEGLAALLGGRLRSGELAAADEEVEDALLQIHRQAVAEHLLREDRLGPLTAALAERAVPALALKGWALLARVYDDPGRRPMGDLDLLVPAERWDEALEAVRRAGGRIAWSPARPLTARRFHEVHVDLGHSVLDLHRRLHDRRLFSVDHDGLFARAAPGPGGVLLPDATDLLSSLATHAAQDGFEVPLRSVVDSLLLIAAGDADAGELVERARRWRARRACALWLRTLANLGLDDPTFLAAAEMLDPRRKLLRRAARLPLPAGRPGTLGKLRKKWHLATALDGAHRAMLMLLDRAFWRLTDLAFGWRHLDDRPPPPG